MDFQLNNFELRINNIIDTYDNILFSNPNVVGFARGYKIIKGYWSNEPCLTFYVKNKIPLNRVANHKKIPQFFFGAKTDVIELPSSKSAPKKAVISTNFKNGPISGGDIINNSETNSEGTLTCALSERDNQQKIYALGCNHVLTRHTGPNTGKGNVGDKIYARHNQFLSDEKEKLYLGRLENILPLNFHSTPELAALPTSKTTTMDAATCYVGKNEKLTQEKLIKAGLNDNTYILGTKKVNLKDKIEIIGGFGGNEDGKVTGVNAKFLVEIFPKYYTVLSNGIFTDVAVERGDSGSLGYIRTSTGAYAFGILVAMKYLLGYFLPIDPVLNFLKLDFLRPLP